MEIDQQPQRHPIERRLFPHMTRACRGAIVHTSKTVRHYAAQAAKTTGLKARGSVRDKVDEIGRKSAIGFQKTMKIVFDETLPKWSYRAVPEPV